MNDGNIGISQSGFHECSHRNRKNTIYNTHICQDSLNQYEAEGDSFLDCSITSDGTWYHKLKSKWQSVGWQRTTYASNKKFKMQPLVGKVMYIVFWDKKGLVLLGFREPRQATTSDHYIMTLT